MSNQELPQNTSTDCLHATIKGGLSVIPLAGAIVSKFFGLVVMSPLQKINLNLEPKPSVAVKRRVTK